MIGIVRKLRFYISSHIHVYKSSSVKKSEIIQKPSENLNLS